MPRQTRRALALTVLFLGCRQATDPACASELARQRRPSELPPADLAWATIVPGHQPARLLAAHSGSGGPDPGELALLSCHGDTLARRPVGRLDSVRFRPVTTPAEINAVIYEETGWGTGAATFEIAVLRVLDDSLDLVWQAPYLDYFFPDSGGGGVDSAEVTFPAAGRIHRTVRSQAVVFNPTTNDYDPVGPAKSTSTTFQWDTVAHRFRAE